MKDKEFVVGTVTKWNLSEGWGVVESPDAPGEVFVHFSMIVADAADYRKLVVGATVRFTWEPAQQDEYSVRAIEVCPVDSSDIASPEGRARPVSMEGYSTSLEISLDEDRP
ncbi:cold-shock protein [Streptomyces aidingensis]|uniref:Cold shock protein, CspA family n=1 Tax=Streptomyces aidingensis TaxID=910347 RepID=A0A1I1QCZ3_9ACTN|nr:cold shock domain-containing protein [Streptomyces aidingensis]SFD19961.1 Cold shock protein, CspA family [Streptomyces aidingensis]